MWFESEGYSIFTYIDSAINFSSTTQYTLQREKLGSATFSRILTLDLLYALYNKTFKTIVKLTKFTAFSHVSIVFVRFRMIGLN